MNYFLCLLITFSINSELFQSKILKFKFELYPFNIAGIDSIKSFISYYPDSLNKLA